MPQILVIADSPQSAGEVVYRERVARSSLESEHFAGQLMERVGWAVGDADELESRPSAPAVEEHPVAPPTFVGR
ncbi:MAG TPA: hypothetical protein VFX44_00190 [Solirubrobacterales bacterium]|nr:hypothetical protein [Solirubrobacterales bacterium]